MTQATDSARELRALKVLGAACFGGGLLFTAVGILLIVLGALNGPWYLTLIGAGVLLTGLSTSFWGMVMLYRSLIRANPALAINVNDPETHDLESNDPEITDHEHASSDTSETGDPR
ncbi:hypothetical protein M2390_001625 [Mycetocola sp. BIGb0189]|uniref:hypothetical protein n=1 Tax=Mycetocola sp. BIGb0189 TaxID=2940604 RepID=UPI002166E229|nr:hypothetical protein [Mycetocola sp. BIGb0189]MCS4276443.1 hypothetical protein [Mycetocola sp. BIGb0189]